MKAPLRVKELAEQKGLNALKIHHLSGLAYDTVLAYWHSNLQRLDWNVMKKLAVVLDCHPRDLLGDE